MSTTEAEEIEMVAANIAYECGLGVGEWEGFLLPGQVRRLVELAEQGFGTWGREPHTLRLHKEALARHDIEFAQALADNLCQFDLAEVPCEKCGRATPKEACYFWSDGPPEYRDGTYLCAACSQKRFDGE